MADVPVFATPIGEKEKKRLNQTHTKFVSPNGGRSAPVFVTRVGNKEFFFKKHTQRACLQMADAPLLCLRLLIEKNKM